MNNSDSIAGWSVLPNWVIRSNILHGNEKWVYLALLNRANSEGFCYPSITRICQDTNVSRPTVIKALKSLTEKNFITIVKRVKENSQENDSNLYYVHAWEGGKDSLLGGKKETGGVVKNNVGGGKKEALEEYTLKNTQFKLSETSSKASKKGSRISDDFHITESMRAWAKKECPTLDAEELLPQFIDYWKSVPGQRGVKLDWVATWRNFMRNQKRFQKQNQVDEPQELRRINDIK